MSAVVNALEILRRLAQKLGPYVLLELLLPGGTLVALVLFLYRHGRLPAPFGPVAASSPKQVVSVLRLGQSPAIEFRPWGSTM